MITSGMSNGIATQSERCMITLSQMMIDRGFQDCGRYLEKYISPDDKGQTEFHALVSQKQLFTIDYNGNDIKCRFMFAIQQTFKMQEVRKYIENGFDLTIMILRNPMSTTNMKTIEELKKTIGDIQVFSLNELQFNITKHKLVPRHTLLGFDKEKEIEQLVKQYKVENRYKFPSILRTDPVAKYFNAKFGNVMQITRPSPTAGEYQFYRCCI